MNNPTRLQTHKEALELLERIIIIEQNLADDQIQIRRLEAISIPLHYDQLIEYNRRIKLYRRWLGFANRNYTVISSKICGLVELKPTMSKNFKNCNFIDFRKSWM